MWDASASRLAPVVLSASLALLLGCTHASSSFDRMSLDGRWSERGPGRVQDEDDDEDQEQPEDRQPDRHERESRGER